MYYAPLAPQFWGEKLRKSPPGLGDLGGEIASAANQTTYVYTVASKGGKSKITKSSHDCVTPFI